MSAENNTNIYMLQQQYIVMSTPLQVYNHDNSYGETQIHEVIFARPLKAKANSASL